MSTRSHNLWYLRNPARRAAKARIYRARYRGHSPELIATLEKHVPSNVVCPRCGEGYRNHSRPGGECIAAPLES